MLKVDKNKRKIEKHKIGKSWTKNENMLKKQKNFKQKKFKLINKREIGKSSNWKKK